VVALPVPPEKDDFVLHAVLAPLVQMTHVLGKAAPLFLGVVSILGLCIRFLILSVYEAEVLLFLATDLVPGKLEAA